MASPPPEPSRKRERREESEDDDDKPLVARKGAQREVVPGEQCPYLDTISRQVCSVVP